MLNWMLEVDLEFQEEWLLEQADQAKRDGDEETARTRQRQAAAARYERERI